MHGARKLMRKNVNIMEEERKKLLLLFLYSKKLLHYPMKYLSIVIWK